MLNVKVIPNSKKNSVLIENGILKVHVNAPALDGKANKVLIDILSDFLEIKKSKIKIIKGEKSRLKIVEIT